MNHHNNDTDSGEALNTAQQNTVSITVDRHSGNLLAGIHKSVLDTG